MKKINYFLPFILSAFCFISFNIIGSTVDSNGFVHEPFFLVPIGFAFFFIGLISLIIKGSITFIKKSKY